MPGYIYDTIRYMNNHIAMAQKLNEKLEQWLKKSGVTVDGYDFVMHRADSVAYAIYDMEGFECEVNEILAKMQEA